MRPEINKWGTLDNATLARQLFIFFLPLLNGVSLEFRGDLAERVKVRQSREEIAVTNLIIISVFHCCSI